MGKKNFLGQRLCNKFIVLTLTYVEMILKHQVSNSLLCRVSSCSGGWSTVGFSLTGRRMAWICSSVSSSNNPPPAKQQALHQGPWEEYKDEDAVEKFVISWGRQDGNSTARMKFMLNMDANMLWKLERMRFPLIGKLRKAPL